MLVSISSYRKRNSVTMVYNYTIPRGPIAAMYTSPGPCYGLPGLCGHIQQTHDPRSVHLKKPAYTFGLKPPLKDSSCSPGPKYKPDAKVSCCKVQTAR